MSEIRVNNLSNESDSGGPTISGITTFSSPYFFVPPVGNTAERPENPENGSVRFNTDSKHLEYFKGDAIGGWVEVEASNDELDGGNRGVAGGGWTPGVVATIKYYTISTLGSEQSFGDLTRAGRNHGACASRTRGVFGGTFPQAYQATIDYITFSQPGNAIDFGDLTLGRTAAPGLSSSTRGCWAGGYSYSPGPSAMSNIIDYIEIASTGNALDFGDLLNVKEFNNNAGCSSTTRGLWMATALDPSTTSGNTIEYITIATAGNAKDFGDISNTGEIGSGGACSNATRALYGGGHDGAVTNIISYVTITTLGNSIDFGDLTAARFHLGVFSSPTRGVWLGGRNPNLTNTMDYIEIATLGNAVDWGDMYDEIALFGTTSNGHGGL